MPIQFFEEKKYFLLQGKETTYAFRVMKDGQLCHLHWGRKMVTETGERSACTSVTPSFLSLS